MNSESFAVFMIFCVVVNVFMVLLKIGAAASADLKNANRSKIYSDMANQQFDDFNNMMNQQQIDECNRMNQQQFDEFSRQYSTAFSMGGLDLSQDAINPCNSFGSSFNDFGGGFGGGFGMF